MKNLACIAFLLLTFTNSYAQKFEDYFENKTLRVDYIFTGNAKQQAIYLDELSQLPSWAGRQHHLDELPLEGNGQVIVKDFATKKCIYKTSFSSLFQEWLTTDEAKETAKGFENSFLLPYPKQPIEVEVKIYSYQRKVTASLKHIVKPDDILIHKRGTSHVNPHRYIHRSGTEQQCIDVAILAEGYTKQEMDVFYKDAVQTCESLFSHEPFKSMKNKFNIVAVAAPSTDSGVSVPRENAWKETTIHSHFDTFYSERYLTTSRVKSIHNALAGIPYEHIIILANTDVYGGGGIYNSYTLTTAHHPMFKSVVVHEFGHSFGGLADEYYYENDTMTDTYPLDIEPWEQNISTLVDFDAKWKDMLLEHTPIPTPVKQQSFYKVGVYEGGGYSAKGIFRPAYNCRMKTNEHPSFCPVCQRALKRIIEFYVP
ncbi:IgA peptidase M64 family protein [gut metagenome]|uniref:IgA peptidase M64 family protein n=1 Tax=gut metagenome TaxID=749906 RepID=J9D0Z4_9ZZZZ